MRWADGNKLPVNGQNNHCAVSSSVKGDHDRVEFKVFVDSFSTVGNLHANIVVIILLLFLCTSVIGWTFSHCSCICISEDDVFHGVFLFSFKTAVNHD